MSPPQATPAAVSPLPPSPLPGLVLWLLIGAALGVALNLGISSVAAGSAFPLATSAAAAAAGGVGLPGAAPSRSPSPAPPSDARAALLAAAAAVAPPGAGPRLLALTVIDTASQESLDPWAEAAGRVGFQRSLVVSLTASAHLACETTLATRPELAPLMSCHYLRAASGGPGGDDGSRALRAAGSAVEGAAAPRAVAAASVAAGATAANASVASASTLVRQPLSTHGWAPLPPATLPSLTRHIVKLEIAATLLDAGYAVLVIDTSTYLLDNPWCSFRYDAELEVTGTTFDRLVTLASGGFYDPPLPPPWHVFGSPLNIGFFLARPNPHNADLLAALLDTPTRARAAADAAIAAAAAWSPASGVPKPPLAALDDLYVTKLFTEALYNPATEATDAGAWAGGYQLDIRIAPSRVFSSYMMVGGPRTRDFFWAPMPHPGQACPKTVFLGHGVVTGSVADGVGEAVRRRVTDLLGVVPACFAVKGAINSPACAAAVWGDVMDVSGVGALLGPQSAEEGAGSGGSGAGEEDGEGGGAGSSSRR